MTDQMIDGWLLHHDKQSLFSINDIHILFHPHEETVLPDFQVLPGKIGRADICRAMARGSFESHLLSDLESSSAT